MASKIKVHTQGQTLKVTITTPAGTAPTVYTTSALSGTHTMPLSISADTEFWLNYSWLPFNIEVAQPDGSVLYSARHTVSPDAPILLSPEPSTTQVSADLARSAPGGLAAGIATFPRWAVQSTAVAPSSGSMRLAGFRADRSETVTKVRYLTGGTAAAATPTVVRIGLYSVDSAGAGTLVASTPNDTALSANAHTSYEKSFSSPYAVVAGQQYALGYLIVSGAATNTLVGTIQSSGGTVHAENAFLPRVCAIYAGQSDLPASYTDAALTNASSIWYGVVLA